MTILTLQRRARELGRIRIGQVVSASNGKTRPAKIDKFRITSHSRHLIERIAELYGGTAKEWQPMGGGPAGWEVFTDSTRLPILVPPQPVSQYMEHWSKGGCARRCDGITELLSDKPCLCGPDPTVQICKPTTRLNVVLKDVEGIGVFRLETHGWYAATELPMAAELLAQANGYISGHLGLEERVVKRDGETRRFMVPTLEVDMTPAALFSGQQNGGAIGQARPQLAAAEPKAIAAAPEIQQDADSFAAAVQHAANRDELMAIYADAKNAGVITDDLTTVFQQRAAELDKPTTPAAEQPVQDDADALWAEILRTVPEDWTTDRVEQDFAGVTKADAGTADAAAMRRYLEHLGATK